METGRVELQFGHENLTLETGKLARQADGAVTVTYGGTVVLVSACVSKELNPDFNFLPLTVEYQEKTYAAGKIPGGFFRREGRPSENEILTARLIDRPIRPLFPKGFFNEIQVMGLVLSSDGENDPDILALIGASAALSIAGIPFEGPLGVCRVGYINNEFILNPTYKQIVEGKLDIVVVGTKDGIIMLEAKAKEVEEEILFEAIKFGYNNFGPVISIQEELIHKCAKDKMQVTLKTIDPQLLNLVNSQTKDKIESIFLIQDKESRQEAKDSLVTELLNKFTQQNLAFTKLDVQEAVEEIEGNALRSFILDKGKRIDGRSKDEIRPIECLVGVLPRTHGSSLFTRGSTQSLAVTTLGSAADEQMIEALEGETFKSFMLHYSFPPFSVGEVKPVRGPGRREIGHGALAEKALQAVMPSKEEFPYTVRVVSEILESNGSSSMATVCAAALSLMDAGVPIKAPVAGVALGLIKEADKSVLLTDIAGLEDHFGDMDFKVAGTKEGLTTLQLDIKIKGIGLELIRDAFGQARKARLFILDKMAAVINSPRESLSPFAPRINILKINPEKIGELIGPGGKTIKKIIKTTGVSVDIEDDGRVLVASTDPKASQEAIQMIMALTEDVEVGRIYSGSIKRITNFGAFCEIAPGKEGLIHISELSDKFVRNVEEVVKVGDEVKVKVVNIDEMGRINLSKKQVPPEDSGAS